MARAPLVVLLAALTGCAGSDASSDAGAPSDAPARGEDVAALATPLAERCFAPLDTTREAYAERLRGLWLAENVANWTGLLTEFQRKHAPFYRDEDWGTPQGRWEIEGSAMGRIELNFLDPWGSDDDTDVEMIYLEAMREAGTAHLTPAQIRDAWRAHVVPDQFVWVSNRAARRLFDEPIEVLPPSTGLLAANDQALMIDAQLTTEIFGALAPGRPAHALALADLPITTVASGYAVHAAQLHVALYALAPVVRTDLAPAAQIECLLAGARSLLPDGSKAAEVVDRVAALHAASADRDDWERARDELARVFQEEDDAHGFRYLEWYESPVNLATGLLALLFGEGELVRTIRIGTLSGWDSDNGTATMGGLLGLLRGEAWVRAELAAAGHPEVSGRYRIARTRVGFPQDEYSLEEIAALMMPRVEESLRETGGEASADGALRAPRLQGAELSVDANPYVRRLGRSALVRARHQGDPDAVARSLRGEGLGPTPASEVLGQGLALDPYGRDPRLDLRDETALATGVPMRGLHAELTEVELEARWTEPALLSGVRIVEGPHTADGGWLEDVRVEVLGAGGWEPAPLAVPFAGRPERAFELHDVLFAAPVEGRGVRLVGTPGGSARRATLAGFDGLLAD
jgi:hypothetical protein